MVVKDITDPHAFHNVNKMAKSYGTPERALETARKLIEPYDMIQTFATIIPVQRQDGRWHPVVVFQGKEAVQSAVYGASLGFLSIA